jgi:hypothetical protein
LPVALTEVEGEVLPHSKKQTEERDGLVNGHRVTVFDPMPGQFLQQKWVGSSECVSIVVSRGGHHHSGPLAALFVTGFSELTPDSLDVWPRHSR